MAILEEEVNFKKQKQAPFFAVLFWFWFWLSGVFLVFFCGGGGCGFGFSVCFVILLLLCCFVLFCFNAFYGDLFRRRKNIINQDSAIPVLELILSGQEEMKVISRHMFFSLIRIQTVYHIDG